MALLVCLAKWLCCCFRGRREGYEEVGGGGDGEVEGLLAGGDDQDDAASPVVEEAIISRQPTPPPVFYNQAIMDTSDPRRNTRGSSLYDGPMHSFWYDNRVIRGNQLEDLSEPDSAAQQENPKPVSLVVQQEDTKPDPVLLADQREDVLKPDFPVAPQKNPNSEDSVSVLPNPKQGDSVISADKQEDVPKPDPVSQEEPKPENEDSPDDLKEGPDSEDPLLPADQEDNPKPDSLLPEDLKPKNSVSPVDQDDDDPQPEDPVLLVSLLKNSKTANSSEVKVVTSSIFYLPNELEFDLYDYFGIPREPSISPFKMAFITSPANSPENDDRFLRNFINQRTRKSFYSSDPSVADLDQDILFGVIYNQVGSLRLQQEAISEL